MCVLSTVWKILFVVSILWTGETTTKKTNNNTNEQQKIYLHQLRPAPVCVCVCVCFDVWERFFIFLFCTTTNEMLFCMNFSQIHFDRLDLELLPFTSCVIFFTVFRENKRRRRRTVKKNIPNTTTDKKLEFLLFCHYTCIVQSVLVMIATIDR